jgi:hypothetical protein
MRSRLAFLFALTLLAAPAADSRGEDAIDKITQNVCEITGVVAGLDYMARSPLVPAVAPDDQEDAGVPLSTRDQAISVKVSARKPHYRDTPSTSACNRGAKGEVLTYKLCSMTAVKKGDQIRATEGIRAGATASPCLFDLEILPKG